MGFKFLRHAVAAHILENICYPYIHVICWSKSQIKDSSANICSKNKLAILWISIVAPRETASQWW